MSDSNFPLSTDDDLPRTFRRARQERDAAIREAEQLASPAPDPHAAGASAGIGAGANAAFEHGPSSVKPHVVVREFKISFFHLMFFFIKAVFAAIPAMIILGALLWFAGEFLTSTYPELLKMKILIQFPN